ncbi:MAG TPA: transaldolase, partial [Armatimonadota bacterium]|nr:transaldolase [Armatimonadota bacterium]
MADNLLRTLEAYGQSIWLDFIRRGMLMSGELQRFIDEDGVSGMTSNPSIFEKAIAGSHDYDESIRALAFTGKSVEEMYQALTVEDIQSAADIFRPTFDRLNGYDGYISLEVSPHLAHDTEGTIAQARTLWQAVDRPNCFIKVPATRAGIPAIRQLTSEGINVNVTLLFGIPRYHEVADAYLSGLEERAAQGNPLNHVTSVASFFLSRIDVLVDPLLEKLMQNKMYSIAETAAWVHGQVAIASAQVAYQDYKALKASERMQTLIKLGAHPQRLLWASTSTKNPTYSDVKYVDALIGPETINTLPQETINAYRDHGHPALRLEEDVATAKGILQALNDLEINLDTLTQQLEDEGVEKFS